MKTLCFIGNSETPAKLLDLFKKMTPGQSGCWGQLQGVPIYNADYYAVIDILPAGVGVDESKCIFLGAHAPESHEAYKDMRNYRGLKMYDCRHTFGFGEWWIKYDYDYLTNLQPMNRTKTLASIVSNADSQLYHKMRRIFLDKFCSKYSSKLDLYGRIIPWGPLNASYKGCCGSSIPTAQNNDHMSGKEPVYESYKYAIEFDAFGKHYWSERVFDCLLLWCYPIYTGGETLQDYIPKESFSYFNLQGDGKDIMDIIEHDPYEKAIPYMKIAREKLLNEWSIWPRVHQAIFGTTK